jgi:hypothetical protein
MASLALAPWVTLVTQGIVAFIKASEQCTLKNVNNYFNTNIYSHIETSGGQSFNLYLNVVHFLNTSVK